MDRMIGRSVPRKEDARLLTGNGRFVDDVSLAGQAHAVMLRSPHAHARILGIDTGPALAAPGALAVLTGEDFRADGLGRIPHNPFQSSPPDILLENRDGSTTYTPDHMALPADKARHVGEAVALVVAETQAQALDAAELVGVDYEPLPAATATEEAAAPGAPPVWDEAGNVSIDADVGDRAGVEAAFARADRVVRLRTTLARVTGVPMEPRAAVGVFDPAAGRYTLYTTCGGGVRYGREIAQTLDVPQRDVRVVVGDVGGSYGTRNAVFAELPLLLWAARRLGRAVKWTADRNECFLTDYQARDLVVEAALAFSAAGDLLALSTSNLSNVGAYPTSFIPLVKGIEIMPVTYRLPTAFATARAVMSNTPPTYPYRSAGRPEVIYAMERMIDMAARDLGIDRVAIRRRNLIPVDALPYDNKLGMTYDSGDFDANLAHAVALGDWSGFRARRDDSARRGRRRGIGIANYVDLSTGTPVERTELDVRPEGRVDVVIGTQATGQGHETSFAQLVADLLGAPFEAIALHFGDTDVARVGGGSHSGRSMRLGAVVLSQASEETLAKGKRIAAHVLEAAVADIEYDDGRFRVAGTDRSLGLFDAAGAAAERADLPAELRGRLGADAEVDLRLAAFGTGCHVCEVEVDPDTGIVEILGYAAVDDVGRAINPLLIDGQTHGGVAQGIGQALMEQCCYDPDSGQMLAGSFMDYAMPRAADLPFFATRITEVPSPSNPLGLKPGSEGGTAGAPAAVANAIVDALAADGVRHIELPATPERVWRALRAAQGGAATSPPRAASAGPARS